uniref:Uncharacterized protein n=1 Tax=Rhizophora mucronata TaxID=61149 RepID=A0A2P2KU25_RHIMU
MPKQLFLQLNPCLEASFLQELVRLLGTAKCSSNPLLHQQHFLMPMHIAQQQARNSFLRKHAIKTRNLEIAYLFGCLSRERNVLHWGILG